MPQANIFYPFKLGGVSSAGLLGKQGDQMESQRHAAKYLSAYGGSLFVGANQAGVALSAALATTYTGLCLSNPAGSGVNLAVGNISGLLFVAPAALTALGLIAGYAAGGVTVHTTPLTPVSAQSNGAAPVGLLDAACTLVGTPAWVRWLKVTPAATSVFDFSVEAAGGLLIQPGGYLAIGASIAGPAAGFRGSIEWEESPI